MITPKKAVESRPRKSRRGFSLTELLVAMSISTMVMTGVTGVFLGVMRSARGAADAVSENARARLVQESFLFDLRSITEVEAMSAQELKVRIKDFRSGGEERKVVFSFNQQTGQLVRTDTGSGVSRVIMSGLDEVTFTCFKRGTCKIPAAKTADVNAIQVQLAPKSRLGLVPGASKEFVTTLVQLRNRS